MFIPLKMVLIGIDPYPHHSFVIFELGRVYGHDQPRFTLRLLDKNLSQPTIGVKASDEMKERTLATRLGTAIKIPNDWDMK